MFASEEFLAKDRGFWAYVRIISAATGYTDRSTGNPKKYDKSDVNKTIDKRNIAPEPVLTNSTLTDLGKSVIKYLNFRADKVSKAINLFRSGEEAESDFDDMAGDYELDHFQTNKQGNNKPLFLANTVNLVLEKEFDLDFNPNPRDLVTISDDNGELATTLSRRLDGACPALHNPAAIWEVKEFYRGKSFGSRIADAVYESMLVGEELTKLEQQYGIKVYHYLIVDGGEEWSRGKSYICRIIDILNMGLIDAAILGGEVTTQWPDVVNSWDIT